MKKPTVYSVMAKILYSMDNLKDTPSYKADLAEIRHTIGKPIEEATEAWPILFENLPEEFLSKWKNPTYEEIAILTTLQLYALHQQGKAESVLLKDNERWENIGTAFRSLRIGEDSKSIDRRFNVLITSTNFDELNYHLRQMVKLLRSRTNAKINYPRVADDLYKILRGYDSDVKLRWSREYYRINNKENDNDEK